MDERAAAAAAAAAACWCCARRRRAAAAQRRQAEAEAAAEAAPLDASPEKDAKWREVRGAVRERIAASVCGLHGRDAVWRFRGEHHFLSNVYQADFLTV
eukprot:gene12095-4070_t